MFGEIQSAVAIMPASPSLLPLPLLPFLLFLLAAALLLLFLSPTALPAANVVHLPGFNGPLPFELETGYESVEDVELFYYFIRSEGNPRQDPVLLWLTGGPGCSSFCGLATEIGPVRFKRVKCDDGSLPSLVYHPYSWTKIANIIFLDSPVGSGFSFSRFSEAYEVDDTISVRQTLKFLTKWYAHHPNFLSNPFYMGGDSYAGKIVPIVAHEIDIGNNKIPPFRNLKGYLVGNPVTGEVIDGNSRVTFAHRMGIISDDLYKVILENCEGEDYKKPNPHNIACFKALSVYDKCFVELNGNYILDPSLDICPVASRKPEVMIGDRRSLGEEPAKPLHPPEVPDIQRCSEYGDYLSYLWANHNSTREALNIKKESVGEWVRCNQTLKSKYTSDIPSSLKYHLNLMQKGYRALIYSGDFDSVVPYMGTHAWIRSFNLSIVDDWRSWHVDGEVAGYTRKFAKDVTFATVKNAGHTAPTYQPKTCMFMFKRWISHKRL